MDIINEMKSQLAKHDNGSSALLILTILSKLSLKILGIQVKYRSRFQLHDNTKYCMFIRPVAV